MRDKDTSAWREMFQYSTLVNKGRMAAPNRMNFRNGSKGGGSFSIQKIVLQILGTEIDTKE